MPVIPSTWKAEANLGKASCKILSQKQKDYGHMSSSRALSSIGASKINKQTNKYMTFFSFPSPI
jgi:hypothetical protein